MRNIIILGSGRSGTSLLAGSFRNSGYYIGRDYISPRNSNPKGFFEGQEINRINETILTQSGFIRPWAKGQKGRAALIFGSIPTSGQLWLARVPLDGKIVCSDDTMKRIAEQTSYAPYCFKDPRFSYTLPAWRPYLKNTVFLCIFRHPAATVESIMKECKTVPYLSSLRMNPGIAEEIWRLQYRHILERHYHEGDWLLIHYEQMFDNSVRVKLSNAIGASIDHDFADPRLSRSKSLARIQDCTQRIYSQLCALAGYEDS